MIECENISPCDEFCENLRSNENHTAQNDKHNDFPFQSTHTSRKKPNGKNDLLIMYNNIRGLKGKMNSLNALLNENCPHIFLLTETQLRSNNGINIPGYVFHSRKREEKVGGGVAILVRDDIRSNTFVHQSQRNLEIVWISLRRQKKCPLMIGCYYGKQESISKADIELEMNVAF